MRRRLLAGGEDAGAFERDVDAERLVRQLGRIPDRRHLDLVAVDDDRVALDLDLVRKAPVHAVVAQEMGVGLDRTQIVDGDDFDVLAARFEDRAQHQPPDAAEAVDRYLGNHRNLSSRAGHALMAGDALQFNPLKPRLLSDPRPEVYRLVWSVRYPFRSAEARPGLFRPSPRDRQAKPFPKPGPCAGKRQASRDHRRMRSIAGRACRSLPRSRGHI